MSVRADLQNLLRGGRAIPSIGVSLAFVLCLGLVEAAPLDLAATVKAALDNDVPLRQSHFDVDIANARKREAGALLWPKLSVDANYQKQLGDIKFGDAPTGDRNINTYTATLQLSQPLWRGSSWTGLSQAELRREQASAKVMLAQQEVLERTVRAYFEVLSAQQSLAAAEVESLALGELLAVKEHGAAVGTMHALEAMDAGAGLKKAQAAIATNRGLLLEKQAGLRRITGMETIETMMVAPYPLLPDSGHLSDWQKGVENNLKVRVRALDVAIALKEMEKQRAEHQPTLDFTASYGYSDSSGNLSQPANLASKSTTTQIGLRFSLPLFNGMALVAREEAATGEYQKARLELELAMRDASALVDADYRSLQSVGERIAALQSQLAAVEADLVSAEHEAQVGTKIKADAALIRHKRAALYSELQTALGEWLLKWLRLNQAVGAPGVLQVKAINDLLIPAAAP